MASRFDIKEAEFRQKIGFRTRIRRLLRGISVAEAAQRAGMPGRQWEHLEEGRIKVTLLTLVQVAKGLNVAPDVVLDDLEPEASRQLLN